MQPSDDTAAAKKDNLFGICAALGEEFHFNPLFLRLALAISLLWNPVAVLAIYFYTGLVLLIAYRLAPRRSRIAAVREADPAPTHPPADSDEASAEEPEYARAA